MPHNPTGSVSDGAMPIIDTRRGMRGAMLHGLWIPLSIVGGDGTEGDPPPPPPPADPPPPPDDKSRDMAGPEALAAIAKLREELKEARAQSKEAETLRSKLKAIEDAQLSESEKLAKERDEFKTKAEQAEQRVRDTLIRAAVERESHSQGAVKADVVFRLLDKSGLEIDESGEVKGAEKAVKALLEAEPYLLKVEPGTHGVPGSPKPNGGPKGSTESVRQEVESMRATGRYTV